MCVWLLSQKWTWIKESISRWTSRTTFTTLLPSLSWWLEHWELLEMHWSCMPSSGRLPSFNGEDDVCLFFWPPLSIFGGLLLSESHYEPLPLPNNTVIGPSTLRKSLLTSKLSSFDTTAKSMYGISYSHWSLCLLPRAHYNLPSGVLWLSSWNKGGSIIPWCNVWTTKLNVSGVL